MRILYFLLIAFFLTLSGCGTDYTRFQDAAVEFASNDKKIDEKEYNSLVEKIKTSGDESFKKLFTGTNGEIDNSKVVEYLLRLFTAKKNGFDGERYLAAESNAGCRFQIQHRFLY